MRDSRTNMLIHTFGKRSVNVKLHLFRRYCMCVLLLCGPNILLLPRYDSKYCYRKCIKMFFEYLKYHSITAVTLDLKLSSSDTVVHYFRHAYMMSIGIHVY